MILILNIPADRARKILPELRGRGEVLAEARQNVELERAVMQLAGLANDLARLSLGERLEWFRTAGRTEDAAKTQTLAVAK